MAVIKKPKKPKKTATVKTFQAYEQKVKEYTVKMSQKAKDETYKAKLLALDVSKIGRKK